jgi:hypothetical protein
MGRGQAWPPLSPPLVVGGGVEVVGGGFRVCRMVKRVLFHTAGGGYGFLWPFFIRFVFSIVF